MSQFRYSNVPMPGYADRINQTLDNLLHTILRPLSNVYAASIPELLLRIQEVTSPKQLTNLVNRLQRGIWYFSPQEQLSERKQVADALARLMQYAAGAPLRLEAAGWLRLFVQTAYLAQPEQVFVTLVTAAVHTSDPNEQRAYLKMTFDCFWPFRYPYAAYNWESFPNNEVFYPLAPCFRRKMTRSRTACSPFLLNSLHWKTRRSWNTCFRLPSRGQSTPTPNAGKGLLLSLR